jgi:hypothetical protein
MLYGLWGYRSFKGIIPTSIKNIQRSNPDVETMYTYDNVLITQLYHTGATSLRDSSPVGLDIHTWKVVNMDGVRDIETLTKSISQIENPNEIMASIMPIIIKNDLQTHPWIKKMDDWIKQSS